MNKIWDFIKENVLLIVPSTLVLIVLFGFLTFGLSRPESETVDTMLDITLEQQKLEEIFMANYTAGDYSAEEPFIVLDPFGVSPLSALMVFETEIDTQYEVVVRGKERNGDMTFVTNETTMHYIPLYGLYPNYFNTIEVYEYVGDARGQLISSTYVQTEKLPENVVIPTEINTTFDYFGNDLMLLIPALKSYPIGVDYNGDVRFLLTKNLSFAPVVLENGHLLLGSDRPILSPYYMTGLYEIDYLGKVYRDYKIPGGYHHDVVELPDGNLMVLSDDFSQGTVEDVVVEIDRNTGEIVDEIYLLDILPELDGMSENYTATDWFHNNSIDYDEATDQILLSGRHQDAVVSINRTTKELNYVIGDPNNWGEEFVSEYFFTPVGTGVFEWQYSQHDAQFLPNGDIFLFDNGNNKSKFVKEYVPASESYSRGVIYSINETAMTIEQVYQFGKEIGSDFYSPYISNVDYYADGHYMVHSGGHGVVNDEILNIPGPLYDGDDTVTYRSMTYEIEDGEIKYYLEVADNFYRAKRIQLYTEDTVYRTGRGATIGSLAVTEVYTGEVDTKFNLLDTVPEIYGVNLLKEGDRLKFEGQFEQFDTIYMKLVSDDQELVYYIPTSRTDYTAMCTVTFENSERFVTYYINETNVTGDFQIYLIINGREFNTYKHVTFN